MAMSTRKLRPILSSVLGLTLGGLALTLLGVAGGPAPAAASAASALATWVAVSAAPAWAWDAACADQ